MTVSEQLSNRVVGAGKRIGLDARVRTDAHRLPPLRRMSPGGPCALVVELWAPWPCMRALALVIGLFGAEARFQCVHERLGRAAVDSEAANPDTDEKKRLSNHYR